jgi:hypothetical protein
MIEYELNFRQQFTDINPIPTKTTEHLELVPQLHQECLKKKSKNCFQVIPVTDKNLHRTADRTNQESKQIPRTSRSELSLSLGPGLRKWIESKI